MKEPGPGHPISITPASGRVRVLLDGKVVADSKRALALQETTMAPVFYIPREDTDMALLTRTVHSTHCPYKGDASYFSIATGDVSVENAVWSYETPFPAMAQIAGFLAFYPNKVKIETQPA
jgi:uncharacterized protein (DUF427 family)